MTGLDRVLARLTGPNPEGILNRDDEYLALTDPAGFGLLLNQLHHLRHPVVLHDHLDLDFGNEVDLVLRPAIDLAVAPLSSEPLDLGHGEAFYAQTRETLLQIIQLEGFDDRFNFFHGPSSFLNFVFSHCIPFHHEG